MSLMRVVLMSSIAIASCWNDTFAAVGAQGPELDYKILHARLSSGVEVDNVVYRKEHLGGKWVLQLKRQSGLTLSRGGRSVQSLNDEEFRELAALLFVLVKDRHRGRLDRIQMDLNLAESLWKGGVETLRNAPIAPDYVLDPKSDAALSNMQSYLDGTPLVAWTCEQAAIIGRSCKRLPASMNPPVFKSACRRMRWENVRVQPNSCLDDSNWFEIDLKIPLVPQR